MSYRDKLEEGRPRKLLACDAGGIRGILIVIATHDRTEEFMKAVQRKLWCAVRSYVISASFAVILWFPFQP